MTMTMTMIYLETAVMIGWGEWGPFPSSGPHLGVCFPRKTSDETTGRAPAGRAQGPSQMKRPAGGGS